MTDYSFELQDHKGDRYYPHGLAETTFLDDGSNVAERLEQNLAALEAHNEDAAAHPDIRAELVVLRTKIQLLENAVFSSGIQDNRTVVTFTGLDSVELIKGNYNEALQYIECTKGA